MRFELVVAVVRAALRARVRVRRLAVGWARSVPGLDRYVEAGPPGCVYDLEGERGTEASQRRDAALVGHQPAEPRAEQIGSRRDSLQDPLRVRDRDPVGLGHERNRL